MFGNRHRIERRLARGVEEMRRAVSELRVVVLPHPPNGAETKQHRDTAGQGWLRLQEVQWPSKPDKKQDAVSSATCFHAIDASPASEYGGESRAVFFLRGEHPAISRCAGDTPVMRAVEKTQPH